MPFEVIEDQAPSAGRFSPADQEPTYQHFEAAPDDKQEVLYDQRNSVVFKTPVGSGRLMRDVIDDEAFNPAPSTTFEQIDVNAQKMSANLAFLLAAKDIIPDDAAAEYISGRARAWQNVQARQPETTKAFFEKWNNSGVFGKTAAIFQYPQAVGREVISQAPNAALPLLAGWAGAKGGAAVGAPTGAAVGSIVPGAGTAAGGATGAVVGGSVGALTAGYQANKIMGAAETLDEIAVKEYGVNPADAESVLEFLTNPDKVESAQKRAIAAGADMAAVETLTQIMTLGISKWTKGMKLSGRLAGAGGSTVLEAGGETGGEAARQYSAFKDVDWNEALFEGVASLGQSAGTTAINYSIVGAKTGAQQAKSVVFKAEQVSQKLEQAITLPETTQAMQEMQSVEQELDQAYEAAVYERGDPVVVEQPKRMAMDAEKAPEIAQQLPDIEFAKGVDREAVSTEAQVQQLSMPERSSRLKTFAKDFGIGLKDTAEKVAAPISTRIKNISPKMFSRVRRFEFETKRQILSDNAEAGGFLQKYRSLPADVKTALDLAMKNGQQDAINTIADQYDMKQEIAALRTTLDNIFERTQGAKMETEYRENFYPRFLKDYDQFMDYMNEQQPGTFNTIDKAIQEKENAMGRSLRKDEKIKVIDSLMLGRKVEGISLATRGELKERTIDVVTPELNQFYADTGESILHYIHVVNEAIETNRLFGKEGRNFTYEADPDRSVGDLVNDVMESDGLSNRDARLLREMLNARFNPGRMSEGMAIFRDLSYVDVMGSPLNAITQFADVAPAIYNAGLLRVAQTLPGAALDNTKINLTDLGINDNVAQEFDNHGWSSRLVNKVFKEIGLQKVDRLGKLTLVNSTIEKQISQAKKNDKGLMKTLELHFGDGAEQVRQDLAAGNITEDVRFLAFNTLLDVQPVARSEMPQYYLQAGNGKIFYMLKTFTIKQIDFYRREGLQNITDGIKNNDKNQIAKGMANFAYIYALWVMSGATADAMKDLTRSLINGDELDEPEDYLIENMYKGFGLNKYSIDVMNRPFMPDTPADFVINYTVPPTKLIDNAWRDYQNIQKKDNIEVKDLRSIRSIPIGGELYWFWFGGGSENDKKSDRKSRY